MQSGVWWGKEDGGEGEEGGGGRWDGARRSQSVISLNAERKRGDKMIRKRRYNSESIG